PPAVQQPAKVTAPAPGASETKFCSWCGTAHAGGTEKCPPGAAFSGRATETKPQSPAADEKIASRREHLPSARETGPSIPSIASVARPEMPRETPPPSRPPAGPQTSARTPAPPQSSMLRVPATQKPEKRTRSVFAIEEALGRNWLNKVGITLLVIGIASFGIYELGQVGPLGKVIASYAAALGLLAGGIFLDRRERYRILGHTLIGGGWALLF